MHRITLTLLIAVLCGCAGGPDPTWDNVTAGACRDCMHEEIDLSMPGRTLVRRAVAIDVQSRSDRKRAAAERWMRLRGSSGLHRIASARFVHDSGRFVDRLDEAQLARWTRCQQAEHDGLPMPDGQGAKCATLPLDIRRDGMLLLTLEFDIRSVLPGGHRSRFLMDVEPRRFGITVKSDPADALHTHGHFDRVDGRLAYVGGAAQEVGVSTVADWSSIAAAYALREDEAMGRFERRPASARPEVAQAALRESASWILRELEYDGTRLAPGDSVYPDAYPSITQTRRGDCKEFALVLRRMLAERGIASESVFVKLDSVQAPERQVPSPSDYDHVVVFVPALGQYVDPTRGSLESMLRDARDRFAYAIHVGDGRVVRTR